MLCNLHVKNLALIEEAEVDFGPGLNILTGETGAGKSILLGSIQLILGGKVTHNMVRANASYALVELIFVVEDPVTLEKLNSLEVETEDGQVLLSRRFSDGRSINRINSQTCTLARLKEVASVLLDLHGQHEHQSLLNTEKQLEILDAFGGESLQCKLEEVLQAYKDYRRCCADVKAMDMDEESRNREIAFLEFELGEINRAALKEGEDEELEDTFRRITAGKRILETLAVVKNLTGGGEAGAGAAEMVSEACRQLSGISGLGKELENLHASLSEIDGLLADLSRELDDCMDAMTYDEEQYREVTARLDLINSMKNRYGSSLEEIRRVEEKHGARLDELHRYEELLEERKTRQQASRQQLDTACAKLSEQRRKCARDLEKRIREGLKDLGFLEVNFSISFQKKKAYTDHGYDDVEYMISTNPGTAPGPLGQIVSGGELSRIMLAIKSILADCDHTETLIFDEIDTGISGRTAQMVSEKMALIGGHHQILCITHLPQIAAMADRHFEIVKHTDGETTVTLIRQLNEEESIRELARLLSGASITPAVLENAEEMKRLAENHKGK